MAGINSSIEDKVNGDDNSNSTGNASENSSRLEAAAEKAAPVEYQPEWTVKSSLQVLGGFMLLFNTYLYLLLRTIVDFVGGGI